ncbi:MAG: helix-turn-helix domain-containing protein [Lachnospiraceae bacterium]|nr:helix-turn-helix domain-containing protein [Lachnospiraceae bacterium]
MFCDNIVMLRNAFGFSQEEVAEKLNISRQAYAKWEKGITYPDIEKCALLAGIYNTTLDALYNTEGLPDGTGVAPAPKGKHLFGVVTMSEKGQLVIPKKARDVMGYNSCEELVVLGDEGSGLALMRVCDFEKQMQEALESIKK